MYEQNQDDIKETDKEFKDEIELETDEILESEELEDEEEGDNLPFAKAEVVRLMILQSG